MTYVNNISSFGGEQTPIELSTLSPPVLQGFGHQMRIPGSLFNVSFNPQFGQSNVQGLGFNPTSPVMPAMNFFNPIATSFNVDLPGSSAENPGVDSLALNNNTFTDLGGGTQTFMTIAGTGNPQTGAVSLDGSGMKAAIESLIPGSVTAYIRATGESGDHTAASDGTTLDFNGVVPTAASFSAGRCLDVRQNICNYRIHIPSKLFPLYSMPSNLRLRIRHDS